MERFNIQEFKEHALGGSWERTLDNGTYIQQFGDASGYAEKTVPKNDWFYTLKEYYGNGILKQQGKLFRKGDYKTGIWNTYDIAGNRTNTTDQDAGYNMGLQAVFAVLAKEKIPFTKEDIYNTITRNKKSADGRGIWYVQWKALPDRLERLQIDDKTQRVINKDFIRFEENH